MSRNTVFNELILHLTSFTTRRLLKSVKSYTENTPRYYIIKQKVCSITWNSGFIRCLWQSTKPTNASEYRPTPPVHRRLPGDVKISQCLFPASCHIIFLTNGSHTEAHISVLFDVGVTAAVRMRALLAISVRHPFA